MKQEEYEVILQYLGTLIQGTAWEGCVYAVGGCVRDEIMGGEIKDIDLCVHLPLGGVRFAEWLRDKGYAMHGVAIYPSFGTAMLHLKAFPGLELEFVQTRKEKYIDHSCRNPATAFGTLEDDCLRRDLTINALYRNLSTGELVDITGKGVNDIRNHVIRTPAAPDVTYDDDPLRILRCVRFASRFGWEIERDTLEGMTRNAHRLAIITRERVRDELDKMLTCGRPVMAMELLRTTGAMHYVMPELEATYDMVQNEYHSGTVWEHTLAVLEHLQSDKLELRMAALLHDIGKVRTRTTDGGKVHFLKHELASADMAGTLLSDLKYSNSFINNVVFLIAHHMVCKPWGSEGQHIKPKKLRRLQYTCGTEERFDDLMLLIDADNNAHAPGKCLPRQVERIMQRTRQMQAAGSAMFGYQLPLNGRDVMLIKGIQPGPDVKECLHFLLKLAFANPLREKEEFVKHLKGFPLPKK
ncbi:MAG: HD domain-containing protein [Muribaculaceae bacterium]|nr:HD domain-containing protein [Muribaculaceae bacterium]